MYMYVYVCIIPVQPLVDNHDSVWKRIYNVVRWSKPCVVLDDELASPKSALAVRPNMIWVATAGKS